MANGAFMRGSPPQEQELTQPPIVVRPRQPHPYGEDQQNVCDGAHTGEFDRGVLDRLARAKAPDLKQTADTPTPGKCLQDHVGGHDGAADDTDLKIGALNACQAHGSAPGRDHAADQEARPYGLGTPQLFCGGVDYWVLPGVSSREPQCS